VPIVVGGGRLSSEGRLRRRRDDLGRSELMVLLSEPSETRTTVGSGGLLTIIGPEGGATTIGGGGKPGAGTGTYMTSSGLSEDLALLGVEGGIKGRSSSERGAGKAGPGPGGGYGGIPGPGGGYEGIPGPDGGYGGILAPDGV
jgi:hypothetical protein